MSKDDGLLKRDETTYVPPTDPRAPLFRELCHSAKNLFNVCLYEHRQRFFADDRKMESWQSQRNRLVDRNDPDYRALPAKVAGETVMEVGRCFQSFFALKKKQREGKLDPTLKVRIPHYLDRDGAHVVTFPADALSDNPIPRPEGGWEQRLCPRGFDLRIVTRMRDVTMVRIQPLAIGYRIHVLYKEQPLPYAYIPDSGVYASIDLGVDNLMTVFINDIRYKPFIVPGGPLKSINQWYNRCKALSQMSSSSQFKLPNKRYDNLNQARKDTGNPKLKQDPRATRTTMRMQRLSLKRKHQLDWLIGNITTRTANYLASIGVSHVIIGLNPDWKQNANMGHETNQHFVQLPYRRIIDTLTYKLNELGVKVTETEESYTSKASFIDHDRIGVYGKSDDLKYSGRRNRRGQYTTRTGIRLNADVNGAGNIMRKVIPDELVYSKGIEALAAGPVRHMNLTKRGGCEFK